MPLRTVAATRYVAPLRQGGSLPALVEADDDGLYVVKLRGAGQGPRALVSELVVGGLATALGLPVPELALVDLDPHLADAEPDPEIQELLQASAGLNAGLDFLPGALPYLPGGGLSVDAEQAAAVVWLDALTENIDRTPRNTNLLVWHERLWLIDHGAALYRQHAGLDPDRAGGAFDAIADHVLLPCAGSISDADARLAPMVDRDLLTGLVAGVPGDWLLGTPPEAYVDYLSARLAQPRAWVAAAEEARTRG
ncbi:MAG TPA: HipA family kinase [Thermoleophilaceae bacterium]|nr:HipA family kinase [Thermoleophilaceae bacterium]